MKLEEESQGTDPDGRPVSANATGNDDHVIHITEFKTVKKAGKHLTIRWGEFCDRYSTPAIVANSKEKLEQRAFNGSTYSGTRRLKTKVQSVSLLILDFDELVTLDEAIDEYQSYEYLLYTTFSHQMPRKSSDVICDKFRIIFPLAVSVSPDQWKSVSENIPVRFAPDADPVSQDFNQPHLLPCHQTGAEFFIRRNRGSLLDVTAWQPVSDEEIEARINQVEGREVIASSHTLYADHLLFSESEGQFTAESVPVKKVVAKVRCPFHTDKSGGEFFARPFEYFAFLQCRHCGRIRVQFDDQASTLSPILKKTRSRESGSSDRIFDPDYLKKFAVPHDRNWRMNKLVKRFGEIKHNHSLIFAPEGAGKSYLSFVWVLMGYRVIFSSKSNAQAQKQYEDFIQRDEEMRRDPIKRYEYFCQVSELLDINDPERAEELLKEIPKRRNVQLRVSREYRLENEYGVKPVMKESDADPWGTSTVDEAATIAEIVKRVSSINSIEEAETLWISLAPADPDPDAHITFTTHARVQKNWLVRQWARTSRKFSGRALGAPIKDENGHYMRGENGKLIRDMIKFEPDLIDQYTVIVFDDPSSEDFMRLVPYSKDLEKRIIKSALKRARLERSQSRPLFQKKEWREKYLDQFSFYTKDGELKEESHPKYFVRPTEHVLGATKLWNRIVFTTTEELTRALIVDKFPNVYCPNTLMPDLKLDAGRIVAMKTSLVSSKNDGLIPPMIERVKRTFDNVEYFADGQGNQYNLVNTRGQNQFIESDTIIEISQPHPARITHLLDELGWSASESQGMKIAIALDALHQALGRNRGYRHTDRKDGLLTSCTVLIDPWLYNGVIEFSRYKIDPPPAYWDDPTWNYNSAELMSVEDAIARLVKGWRTYLLDNRLFQNDVDAAIKSAKDPKKRTQRIATAVRTVIDTEIRKTKTKTELVKKLQPVLERLEQKYGATV